MILWHRSNWVEEGRIDNTKSPFVSIAQDPKGQAPSKLRRIEGIDHTTDILQSPQRSPKHCLQDKENTVKKATKN